MKSMGMRSTQLNSEIHLVFIDVVKDSLNLFCAERVVVDEFFVFPVENSGA